MNLEDATKLTTNMALAYWKGLGSLIVVGIGFSVMAAIYFYIYKIVGWEVALILLAVGLITTNIKDRIQLYQSGYMAAIKDRGKNDLRPKKA